MSISIPYGSIKSAGGDADNPVPNISIPYGSIKSYSKPRGKGRSNNISIPYGSIKREVKSIEQRIQNVFQFLMVRLKDIRAECAFHNEIDFNSLWFD